MKRWFDPDWYRYLASRMGPDARLLLGVAAVAAIAFAGFFSMRALAGGDGTHTESYVQLATRVTRAVRVREHGRIVVKHIPVVRRIYAKPVTVPTTTTVQTPGGTKVVTRSVVRYRPVYRREVVRIHGKSVTVSHVVTDTRMLTDTRLQTVTNEHTSTVVQRVTNEQTSTVVQRVTNEQTSTVVQSQTATVVRTETSPPVTVTVREPTTVTVTTTEPAITVSVPSVTVP